MQYISYSEKLRVALPKNVWAPTLRDLETMADVVGDSMSVRWVRRGKESAIIAKIRGEVVHRAERGALAMRLEDEFKCLCEQVNVMLASSLPECCICAAAFFHLRFVGIHPLLDRNGRVGRVLLSAQCAFSYDVSLAEVIGQLNECAGDYASVFRVREWRLRYELLLDMLAKFMGIELTEAASELPFLLEPVFPDLSSLPNVGLISRTLRDRS
jgi:hypothetical protein